MFLKSIGLLKKSHPLIFYTFLIFLILSLSSIGGYFYARHILLKTLEENHLILNVKDYKIHFKGFSLPGLTLEKVQLKTDDKDLKFKEINIEKADVQPYLGQKDKFSFDSYGLNFDLLNTKITDPGGNYVEGNKIKGNIFQHASVYTLKDFSIEPFHIGLTEEYSTPLQRDQKKTNDLAFIVLYKIIANGNFDMKNGALKFHINIPPADAQMPTGTTYGIDSKGELTILQTSAVNTKEKNTGKSKQTAGTLPAQGKVLFTIDHISNFLQHLHQIRIISFLETVIGQILSPGFITNNLAPGHVSDDAKKQVKIEMKMKKNAIYLGNFKVYP